MMLPPIKGVIGVSGPYDMSGALGYFVNKGMHKNLIYSIFGNAENVKKYSPTSISLDLWQQHVCRKVGDGEPSSQLAETDFYKWAQTTAPVYLLHGISDAAIPFFSSVDFGMALRRAGFKATVKGFFGKTHTAPVLEDLLMQTHLVEDEDVIMDIVAICHGKSLHHAQTNDNESPIFVSERVTASNYSRPEEIHGTPKDRKVMYNPNCVSWLFMPSVVRKVADFVNPW